MKKFRYEAKSVDGKECEGTISASSIEEAIFNVIRGGLYPMRIEEINGLKAIAYGRLDRLKEIRDTLDKRSVLPPVETKPAIKSKTVITIVIITLMIVWAAMMVCTIV